MIVRAVAFISFQIIHPVFDPFCRDLSGNLLTSVPEYLFANQSLLQHTFVFDDCHQCSLGNSSVAFLSRRLSFL
jgi:hypothetical protein